MPFVGSWHEGLLLATWHVLLLAVPHSVAGMQCIAYATPVAACCSTVAAGNFAKVGQELKGLQAQKQGRRCQRAGQQQLGQTWLQLTSAGRTRVCGAFRCIKGCNCFLHSCMFFGRASAQAQRAVWRAHGCCQVVEHVSVLTRSDY